MAQSPVSRSPALLLVAHGTRLADGVAMWESLRAAVAVKLTEAAVRLAFVDVLEPAPETALRDLPGPVVVVPAFLASGYHVRVDLPQQIRQSGRDDVVVTEALGSDLALAEVLAIRLCEGGWSPGAAVVLAVAGTKDSAAQAENRTTARQLGDLLGAPVQVATIATIAQGSPRVDAVVQDLTGHGKTVFVAQYLLADGLFSRKLAVLAAGAQGIAAPLGVHPRVVELIVARYRAALS